MSYEEVDLVATLHLQGVKPKKILSLLQKWFPDNNYVEKDIYNLIDKIKNENKITAIPHASSRSKFDYLKRVFILFGGRDFRSVLQVKKITPS